MACIPTAFWTSAVERPDHARSGQHNNSCPVMGTDGVARGSQESVARATRTIRHRWQNGIAVCLTCHMTPYLSWGDIWHSNYEKFSFFFKKFRFNFLVKFSRLIFSKFRGSFVKLIFTKFGCFFAKLLSMDCRLISSKFGELQNLHLQLFLAFGLVDWRSSIWVDVATLRCKRMH